MSGEREANGAGARRRTERLRRLHDALADGSMLRLSDAAARLGVSEMTVRRDLAAARSPLACLGGYVVRAETRGSAPRYVLDAEGAAHIEGKKEAARRAAALVEPGDTIFVDCGTTTPHVMEALPEGDLTVVCYALNIANLASRRPGTQLIVLGGLFYPASATFYGEETLPHLRRLGIAKAFISAGGVDFTWGVSCSHFHEVPVKQAVMASARHSYLVADSTKFGRIRPAAFARVEAFERVFTDDRLPAAERARLPAPKRRGRPHPAR
jgi:DeoR family deoxyribose operon repressor